MCQSRVVFSIPPTLTPPSPFFCAVNSFAARRPAGGDRAGRVGTFGTDRGEGDGVSYVDMAMEAFCSGEGGEGRGDEGGFVH